MVGLLLVVFEFMELKYNKVLLMALVVALVGICVGDLMRNRNKTFV